MAPPDPNAGASSAGIDLEEKVKAEVHARLAARQNEPPHREKGKIKPTPGPWPQNHGGPIRIISKDGVLTEYGKKVEQERLAKLAATNANEGEKKAESSS